MANETTSVDPVERVIQQAFAPMYKRAFGVAVGLTAAIVLFAATAFNILLGSSRSMDLELLSQYFYGYQVDWLGAFIGAGWAGVVGFVGGFFFAFVRNVVLAAWLFTKRTKAELMAARDILDHI